MAKHKQSADSTPLPNQLVVEGKDDCHVVWSLCEEHEIPETFVVKTPDTSEGIESLLKGLPVRIKGKSLQNLGIVVDADRDLLGRWRALLSILDKAGYTELPTNPDPRGTIIQQPDFPRIGIWLMPNNQLPGMIEDFIAHLIPAGDQLAPRARQTLLDLEQEQLHKYAAAHRPKAFIHTWLAWQEQPGRPMGQSITARVLNARSPLAVVFVEWLRRLFPV